MCETINVTLKNEFRKETELKIFYTAMLVTTRLWNLTENNENANKIQAKEMNFLEASHNGAHYIKLKEIHTNNLNVYLTINTKDDSGKKRLNHLRKWEPRHTGTYV